VRCLWEENRNDSLTTCLFCIRPKLGDLSQGFEGAQRSVVEIDFGGSRRYRTARQVSAGVRSVPDVDSIRCYSSTSFALKQCWSQKLHRYARKATIASTSRTLGRLPLQVGLARQAASADRYSTGKGRRDPGSQGSDEVNKGEEREDEQTRA
jgi:hypothetical protein